MVDKQIDMLSAALAKKPQALGFAALDSKAAIPLLKKAQAAKIPVIAFDSGVDSDIPLTTCTTDNLAAAALAADKMAEAIGNAGEVAVIVHDQTSRTGIDRRDGFLNRDEGEASEHQDRLRAVWRRRPSEVDGNRQGDDPGQSRT